MPPHHFRLTIAPPQNFITACTKHQSTCSRIICCCWGKGSCVLILSKKESLRYMRSAYVSPAENPQYSVGKIPCSTPAFLNPNSVFFLFFFQAMVYSKNTSITTVGLPLPNCISDTHNTQTRFYHKSPLGSSMFSRKKGKTDSNPNHHSSILLYFTPWYHNYAILHGYGEDKPHTIQAASMQRCHSLLQNDAQGAAVLAQFGHRGRMV